MITWDLLLPTFPHRHDQLCVLLAELDRQWQPGLGMRLQRDNLQRAGNASYAKWQELQEASEADYVSFVGDDDFVAADFVSRVMDALQSRPDYVGYPVRYTYDGEPQTPVEHSLRHGGWYNTPSMLYRDIVHHNPVRRELALLGKWDTSHIGADVTWAQDLRNSGQVKTEVWIPDPMYYYQETANSWSRNGGATPAPLLLSEIKPVPDYHWLKVRDDV